MGACGVVNDTMSEQWADSIMIRMIKESTVSGAETAADIKWWCGSSGWSWIGSYYDADGIRGVDSCESK